MAAVVDDGWEGSGSGDRRLRVVAGAVLLALVTAGVGLWTNRPPVPELVVEDATEPPVEPTVGIAARMPEAPISPRSDAVHAWTGEELVVWGGAASQPPVVAGEGEPSAQLPEPLEGLQADGAAFNSRLGQWRRLARGPLEARVDPASAWGADRLFVWGGADAAFLPLADGAAYLPDEDRWEPLPPAPIEGRLGAACVWTGEEFVVLGGFVPDGPPSPAEPPEAVADGAAYDPQAGMWRHVPPPPGEVTVTAHGNGHVWTGERLVIWQGVRGLAYDPARDAWQQLQPEVRLRAPGPTVAAPIGPPSAQARNSPDREISIVTLSCRSTVMGRSRQGWERRDAASAAPAARRAGREDRYRRTARPTPPGPRRRSERRRGVLHR
jgi:hypothetical protein